jgi:hypothetical protein
MKRPIKFAAAMAKKVSPDGVTRLIVPSSALDRSEPPNVDKHTMLPSLRKVLGLRITTGGENLDL